MVWLLTYFAKKSAEACLPSLLERRDMMVRRRQQNLIITRTI